MESKRIINQKLNNKYLSNNANSIRDEAPDYAVCVIIEDERVLGYYGNWIEAMDAFSAKSGAILSDLS